MFLLPLNVRAQDVAVLESRLETIKKEINDENKAVGVLKDKKKELKKSILEINKDLNEIQIHLDELNARIEEVTIELKQAQLKEDEKKEIFHKRLVVLYENGNIAYIEAFFQSNDIMEMSKRTEYIRQISEYDKKIFSEFAAAKREVDSRKKELEKVSDEYRKQKEAFDAQLSAASEEVAAIDAEVEEKNNNLKKLKEEKKEVERAIYELTYAGRVFAEAEKYIGMPYVWGGSTPASSFDCSGFVCWTYTKSGVYNLPRTTAQQIYNQCEKISYEEAQPGDLIFFEKTYDTPDPVSHVGIYAGNDQMLHCGNPIGYTSTQTEYWKAHFYAYGRLRK